MSEKQEEQKQFKIDVESLDAAASRALADPASGMVGQILADRYRIEEIVGRGGMAVVYKAHHMLMNKTVAIKVLLPNLVSEGVTLQRFKNEAQAASSLDHPNVVTVHDFGITPEGQPFLVMDFLEGKTLADTIKANGSLSLERFFEVFSQITSVLEHAHKKYVVHRDIKPGNIVIETGGKVKLLDFGIAKIVSPEGQGLDLTRTGDVFGSPLYMSPEQCNGQKVDERSDIYELGCVMYEALSGQPPFSGDSIFELIQKHAQSFPTPLSAARKSSAILNSLEAIIFRCIAKKPEDRFQSVGELGEALKQAQAQTETPLSRFNSALKLQMLRLNLRGDKALLKVLVLLAFALVASSAVQVLLIQNHQPSLAPVSNLDLGEPSSLDSRVRHAFELMNKGEFAEAAVQFEKAQEAAKAAHDFEQEMRILKARRLLAFIARDKQKLSQLKGELKQLSESGGEHAAETRQQVFVLKQALKMIPDHPAQRDKAEIRTLLRQSIDSAAALQKQGRFDAAVELLEPTLTKTRAVFDERDLLYAQCLLHLAECRVGSAQPPQSPLTQAEVTAVIAQAQTAANVFKEPAPVAAAQLVMARAISVRDPVAALKTGRQLVALPDGQISDSNRLRARVLVADCLMKTGQLKDACAEFETILGMPCESQRLLQHCTHYYARLKVVLNRQTAPHEVVALAKKLEPTQPLAAAELYAGAVRFFSNEPGQWNQLTEHSLLLFQTCGDPLGQMTWYAAEMRARYLERVGNIGQSTSLARQAFAIASLIGDRNEAIKMSVYGTYLRMTAGQIGIARQQFTTLMKEFETGKPETLCDLNEWLAPLAIKFGTTEQIALIEKRSLERIHLLESSSSAETTASRLRALAEFQADTGHPERALVSIRQAAAALETEGALADRESLIKTLNDMSVIYTMLKQKDNAEIAAQHARDVESGTFKFGRHWSP